MRRLLSNMTLALTVFMMMLLLAEGSWRLFIAKGDLGREFDPVLGRINPRHAAWTIRTTEFRTAMRTNADGFRGPSLEAGQRQPGEIRILFIGDSFLEAKQVPEEGRFAERTEVLLEEKLHRPVTVRALGMGGAEPARELLFYRHLGRSFDPDIVVQVIFPENDLLAMTGSYRFHEDAQGALALEDVWVNPPPACHWKCALLQRSEIAVWAYRLIRRFHETPSADPLLGDFGVYTEAGQQALAREGRFTATAAIVSALRDDVERDHGRFLAVLMPGAFEIHAVWREEIERRYTETDSTVWWPSRVVDLFRDALRKRDIAVVDLRPPFLEYETVHPDAFLYHRLDPHLNPTGHAITASALADRLSPLFSP
ncbi:SGNH/GDSL hydrolase family protein [Candidatus Peregrinibacteria bacterium]|nr:SGNH/GDSL hydrolase family protein [Candidatus Peregrinibacteria bacterium]